MPVLLAGEAAPEFQLPSIEGPQFSLEQALKHGPVVLAFFKITCPVCQYALPFLERIYQAHKGNVTIVGISQNPKRDTAVFVKEYGITFPVLLDDPRQYPVSNAYGITNVPTIFMVSRGGEIEVSSVGWNKREVEEINRRLAEEMSLPVAPLFRRGEQIVDYKSG